MIFFRLDFFCDIYKISFYLYQNETSYIVNAIEASSIYNEKLLQFNIFIQNA